MAKLHKTMASRPDREVEAKSSGSGPVKSYKMSPEEMEDYLAKYGDKRATDQPIKKGIDIPMRKPEVTQPNEKVDKRKVAKELNRDQVIQLIAKGYSYRKIEQMLEIPESTLRYQLEKLDLKGLKQEGALKLLGIEHPVLEQPTTSDDETLKVIIENTELKQANEDLQKAQAQAVAANAKNIERIVQLESELQKWNDNDNETQVLMMEIMAERDQLQKHAKELQEKIDMLYIEGKDWSEEALASRNQISELTNDRDRWKQSAQTIELDYNAAIGRVGELATLLAEMTEDRDHWKQQAQENGLQQLSSIDLTSVLNHVLADMKGYQAFATGNAFNQLWHWNSVGDLRNAKFYIDRLIETIEGEKSAKNVLQGRTEATA